MDWWYFLKDLLLNPEIRKITCRKDIWYVRSCCGGKLAVSLFQTIWFTQGLQWDKCSNVAYLLCWSSQECTVLNFVRCLNQDRKPLQSYSMSCSNKERNIFQNRDENNILRFQRRLRTWKSFWSASFSSMTWTSIEIEIVQSEFEFGTKFERLL